MYIYADAVRIYQALLVLINNAIKFSPAGENIVIHITVDADQRYGTISVIDKGCGIAKEHHEKIFERLFQTNTLHVGSNAGLGLGLFICREIVTLHKGEITLESSPGKGSKFSLKFPYITASKDALNEKNINC